MRIAVVAVEEELVTLDEDAIELEDALLLEFATLDDDAVELEETAWIKERSSTRTQFPALAMERTPTSIFPSLTGIPVWVSCVQLAMDEAAVRSYSLLEVFA